MQIGDSINGEDPFSFQDFKKWMSENAPSEFNLQPSKKGIGVEVESKVSLRKLLDRMQIEEGNMFEVAKDFKHNGGHILEIDSPLIMIEVASGTFIIPRSCVRRK